MNKFTVLMSAAVLATSACVSANAASSTVTATVTNVHVMTSNVVDTTYRDVCRNVQVPVYETRRSYNHGSAGDAMLGAVIGGAIGNQFGGGKGKDAMTVLGAIVGADVATNRSREYQVQNGYRTERECYQEPVSNLRRVTNGYAVQYEWNGLRGEVVTDREYRVGDQIPVTVTLN